MNISSKYRRLGIVAEVALAVTMLLTLWACGDDTSPDPTPPVTTLVEPPDTILAEPPVTTLAEPPDTTLAKVPGPTLVEPPGPTLVAVSVRLRILEDFCELCKDELENGLILEQLNDYQGQCGLCKATEVKTTMASRIDRAAGGYTLIVLSSTRRLEAEAAAERFRRRFSSRSLPVDVLVGQINGVSQYRVGLGQVATVAAAVALRNRLAADLPPDTWVTRIR